MQLNVSPAAVTIQAATSFSAEEQYKKSEDVLTAINKVSVDFSAKSLISTFAEAKGISNCIGSKVTSRYHRIVLQCLPLRWPCREIRTIQDPKILLPSIRRLCPDPEDQRIRR